MNKMKNEIGVEVAQKRETLEFGNTPFSGRPSEVTAVCVCVCLCVLKSLWGVVACEQGCQILKKKISKNYLISFLKIVT